MEGCYSHGHSAFLLPRYRFLRGRSVAVTRVMYTSSDDMHRDDDVVVVVVVVVVVGYSSASRRRRNN